MEDPENEGSMIVIPGATSSDHDTRQLRLPQ